MHKFGVERARQKAMAKSGEEGGQPGQLPALDMN